MSRISNLSEETIINIMSRVPAKCVGWCRSLSKRWRVLLSRPEFIRAHLNRSKDLGHKSLCFKSRAQGTLYFAPLLFSNSQIKFCEVTIFPREFSFAGHSWRYIHASCDGLVLVSDKEWRKYVVNPITREFKEIPREPYGSLRHSELCLVYNSGTEDYEVVTLCSTLDNPENLLSVYVFSFKTGTWKRVECSLDYRLYHFTPSGVFANGSIHWVVIRRKDHMAVPLGFDVMRETFHEVRLPNLRGMQRRHSVFDGCLCVMSYSYEHSYEFWVMKEYGVHESWTEFAMDGRRLRRGCVIRPVMPLDREVILVESTTTTRRSSGKDSLASSPSGSRYMQSFSCAREHRERKLALYNLEQRSFMDLVVEFEGGSNNLNFMTFFVDSLVSPLKPEEHEAFHG